MLNTDLKLQTRSRTGTDVSARWAHQGGLMKVPLASPAAGEEQPE